MTKLKIGIVEDEIIIAENIANTLQKIGYNVTETASTYNEAIEMIETEKPDLVLLDIQLKGSKDGIAVAHTINEQFKIPFIFLTANADEATLEKAKGTNPPAYLVKPFTKDDLFTAIEVCFNNFAKQKNQQKEASPIEAPVELLINDALFIKDGNNFYKVKFTDILYLASEHIYVAIVTVSKKHLVRSSLQQYIAHFNPLKFIQIHRSYVVNVDFIDAINSENITINNVTIPLGKTYKEKLLQQLKLG